MWNLGQEPYGSGENSYRSCNLEDGITHSLHLRSLAEGLNRSADILEDLVEFRGYLRQLVDSATKLEDTGTSESKSDTIHEFVNLDARKHAACCTLNGCAKACKLSVDGILSGGEW